jgi:hypothetical protein
MHALDPYITVCTTSARRLVLLQHHYLVQCLRPADPTRRPDTNVLLVVEKDVKVRTLYRARSMACAAHQLTPPPPRSAAAGFNDN